MMNDPDSQAEPDHPFNPPSVRRGKSSWWRSFFASLGSSLLAVALLWIVAALTVGVTIPMAGHGARGFSQLDGALVALLFYILMIPPIPLMIVLLSAVTAGSSVHRHPFAPVKARRLAMLQALPSTLILWGLFLPFFLAQMRAS